MAHHQLRVHPKWYDMKATDLKPWELRSTVDRFFAVGDLVTFHECDPGGKLTGRSCGPVTILYVMNNEDSSLLKPRTCIFTHTPIHP